MAHTFLANVGMPERVGSSISGLALVTYGIARRGLLGAALGFLGAFLIYRGASGRCACYHRLGIDRAGTTNGRGVPGDAAVKVEKSIDISRTPMELYHFWHQLTNLPEIMPHVVSITVNGSQSHWVVRGPSRWATGMGRRIHQRETG